MRYDDPDLLDALAAEYVVGTLRGPARRRFERLLRESDGAREAVDHWHGLLDGMAVRLPAQQPPARVWRRIERSIAPGERSGLWSSLGFWRFWGVAATALALTLAVALTLVEPPPTPGQISGQLAVFADEQNQPMWVITANVDTGTLRARAVNAEAAAADRAYELWLLPDQGPPRSLGLLPVSRAVTQQEIPPALLALLSRAQGLAISLEPAGGSPTGVPTGPVLYQAPVLEL